MHNPALTVPGRATRPLLVVDDEAIVLIALREVLRYQGYQVVTATNAFEGLELLKTTDFSVIISDHYMPRMTGLEFLAQAKQIQPNATRVLVTAVLNLDTVIDAINQGEIYRFLVKPWLREELLATVANAAQRYELICRNLHLSETANAVNEQLKRSNEALEIRLQRMTAENEALAHDLQHSIERCRQMLHTFFPLLGTLARRSESICRYLSRGILLPAEQARTLEFAACLYDVGLIGLPRQLIQRWLRTPDALNAEEISLIRQHPARGQELAGFTHELREVGLVIRGHHERWDGFGFPDQLAGEGVPWLARLLAVATTYAAHPGSPAEAMESVKQGSGSKFDPEAVQAFLRCLPGEGPVGTEREVLLSELLPGMVLAKGIYSATGQLLYPDGQPLNEATISLIRSHDALTQSSQSLLVYC